MAKIADLNQKEWDAFVASHPPVIQELCALLPPDRLYLLKTTGHRVTIIAYGEDRTVRVSITGQFNMLAFERQVFGINPDDLEECDLPAEDEQLGVILTEDEDVKSLIASMRQESIN